MFFDAAGEPEEAVVVDVAHVAGVQAALWVDGFGGGGGCVVVAFHDRGARDDDFAAFVVGGVECVVVV